MSTTFLSIYSRRKVKVIKYSKLTQLKFTNSYKMQLNPPILLASNYIYGRRFPFWIDYKKFNHWYKDSFKFFPIQVVFINIFIDNQDCEQKKKKDLQQVFPHFQNHIQPNTCPRVVKSSQCKNQKNVTLFATNLHSQVIYPISQQCAHL